MSTDRAYAPGPAGWVRDHVEAILAAGDTSVVSMPGIRVILVSMRGRRSGAIRKVPLIRVEDSGRYAALGSQGGSPRDPQWVSNFRADPDVEVLDGRQSRPMRARELSGAERATWWDRAVAAFPDFADYQRRTDRQIPVFVLEPRP